MTPLATHLTTLCRQAGLRPHTVAQQAHLADSHIYRLMHGQHRPRLQTLVRLVCVLQPTVEEAAKLFELAGWGDWL